MSSGREPHITSQAHLQKPSLINNAAAGGGSVNSADAGQKPKAERVIQLLLLGNFGSGKTQLLNRFTNNSFEHSLIATFGLDYAIKEIEIDGKLTRLQICDGSGLDRFNTIVMACMRRSRGIVIVYDISDPSTFDEEVKKRLNEIAMYASSDLKPIVMLVGTKSDKRNDTKEIIDLGEKQNSGSTAREFVKTEDAIRMAEEYNLLWGGETSALESTGVREAFMRILTDIGTQMDLERASANASLKATQMTALHFRSPTTSSSEKIEKIDEWVDLGDDVSSTSLYFSSLSQKGLDTSSGHNYFVDSSNPADEKAHQISLQLEDPKGVQIFNQKEASVNHISSLTSCSFHHNDSDNDDSHDNANNISSNAAPSSSSSINTTTALSDSDPTNESIDSVCIRNLDARFFDKEQVRITFSKFGEMVNLEIVEDETDSNLLVANIHFRELDSAQKCYAALNNKRFDRYKISIQLPPMLASNNRIPKLSVFECATMFR